MTASSPKSFRERDGSADSLDEAKAELERYWRAWCALAGLRE